MSKVDVIITYFLIHAVDGLISWASKPMPLTDSHRDGK